MIFHIDFLQKFKVLISETFGLAINADKEEKLLSSILLRMKERQIEDPLFYYQFLILKSKESSDELVKLVCSLINKESHFFRDKGHFDSLKNEILPALIKKNHSKKELRIWCAGCARGEETYSIAMTLFSLLPNRSNWKITIIGTDLCKDVIEKAHQGLYGEMSFRGMSNEIKERFFLKQESGDYLISSFLRQAVVFKQGNLLLDDFPNQPSQLFNIDLIVCRNVFIYFSRDAIKKVVDKFERTLNQGGILLTGHGELIEVSTHSLKRQILQGAQIFQKK